MLAIKNLSQNDHELISKNLEHKSLEKNQVLYSEGEKCKSMFFVESGALKLVARKALDGRDDVILGMVKAGSFCGEVAMLREESLYEDTAVAMEPTVVLELNQESMQKIMLESMTTGTKLLLGISRNIREAISMPTTQELGKIITLVATKDGQGRTTVGIHLARYLAAAGKKVIFIDCDFQLGDANIHINLQQQPHIARLVQLEERLTFETIRRYFQQSDGICFLASPMQPQESEFVSRSNLHQIVQECAKNCDFLILDAPSHIDEISILLWDIADLMLINSESNLSALTRLKRLMVAVSRLDYPNSKFLGIANHFEAQSKEYLENLQKILPCKWHTIARDDQTFAAAMLKGIPVWKVNSESPASKAMQALCEQILGKPALASDKGGMFGKIKSWFAG